jgi:molecular chaperone GrpE
MNKQDSDKNMVPDPSEKLAAPGPEQPGESSEAEEIEIISDPPKKLSKTDKSAKKAKSRSKKPSDEEVLTRLMEKNQVIVKLNKKIQEIEKNYKDLEDKYLRSLAEFENYRKRSRKEWELLKQQTKAEVILEVLNVLDDFERAFSAVGISEGDDFFEGVRLIYNNLVLALERFNVTPIEALDQPFDPTYHMAVAQVESEETEPNHVVEVAQKGYLMGDLVIRPAKVIIAK